MLYNVTDGQALRSLIVPSEVDERDGAHLHLAHLPADSLTLFDRGYPGHWLFALRNRARLLPLAPDSTREQSSTCFRLPALSVDFPLHALVDFVIRHHITLRITSGLQNPPPSQAKPFGRRHSALTLFTLIATSLNL